MLNIRPNPFGTWHSRLLMLMLFSMAVFAQSELTANGISELPPVYRTPLSDIVSEENTQWRAVEGDENPWRQNKQEALLKTTKKARLFPDYDYNAVDDPATRSLFQNEFELERPRANLFKYSF